MKEAVLQIDTSTQLCAVIGNPVGHSLSPAMHNAAFRALGLNYVYLAFEVEDVGACLAGMRALPSFRGISVTIPHKMAVLPHLDEIDALARHVGCVNTITNARGRLHGTITDGLGTLRAFAESNVSTQGRRVLFLGAGGAARAVAFAMAEEGGASAITLLGRTPARLKELAEDLRMNTHCLIDTGGIVEDLPGAMASHDIVVQGTPMGMYPDHVGVSPVAPELFRAGQIAFDMVYRPLKTCFIQHAESAGCISILGYEMLLHQAVLQFELWTGAAAPVGVMREALLKALQERDTKTQ